MTRTRKIGPFQKGGIVSRFLWRLKLLAHGVPWRASALVSNRPPTTEEEAYGLRLISLVRPGKITDEDRKWAREQIGATEKPEGHNGD